MRAVGTSWDDKSRQQLPDLTWRVVNLEWSLGTRPLQVVGAEGNCYAWGSWQVFQVGEQIRGRGDKEKTLCGWELVLAI